MIIQSVLDVCDDTPGSKSILYNRSILILTSARALKFTATSKERHYVWLTALSFVCRPSIGNHVTLRQDFEVSERPPAAGLFRNLIRDSVRAAKGKARARSNKLLEDEDPAGSGRTINTAADAPNIPRFSTYGRHRSNTGGRPPMAGLRSFTQPIMPSTNPSLTTNVSSMIYSHGSFSFPRTSQASSGSSLTTGNFFETIRMEAFADGRTQDKRWVGDPRKIKTRYHHHQQLVDRSDDANEFPRTDDPFRGF